MLGVALIRLTCCKSLLFPKLINVCSLFVRPSFCSKNDIENKEHISVMRAIKRRSVGRSVALQGELGKSLQVEIFCCGGGGALFRNFVEIGVKVIRILDVEKVAKHVAIPGAQGGRQRSRVLRFTLCNQRVGSKVKGMP